MNKEDQAIKLIMDFKKTVNYASRHEGVALQKRRVDHFLEDLKKLDLDINKGIVLPDGEIGTPLFLFLEISMPTVQVWNRIMEQYIDDITPTFVYKNKEIPLLEAFYKRIKTRYYSNYFIFHLVGKFNTIDIFKSADGKEKENTYTYLIESPEEFHVSIALLSKIKEARLENRENTIDLTIEAAKKSLEDIGQALSFYGSEKEDLRDAVRSVYKRLKNPEKESERSFKFSPFCKNFLTEEDEKVIIEYIERQIGYGISPVNSFFAIRSSNGLSSNRVDVFVNESRIIFISEMEVS